MNDHLKKIYTSDLADIEDYRRFLYSGSLIGCGFLLFFSFLDYFILELYLDSTAEAVGAIILFIIHRVEIKTPNKLWPIILGIITVAMVIMVAIFASPSADGYVIWLPIFPLICFLLLEKKIAFIVSMVLSFVFISTLTFFSIVYPDKGFNLYGVVTAAGALTCVTILSWAFADNRTKMIHLLAQQSKTDTLTSLLNRRGLMSSFNLYLAMYKRNKQNLCMLILDLDHFKSVNDTYGHDVGDIVIIETAKIIKAEVRDVDTVARLGGEEYIAILPNTTPIEAEAIAYRIKNRIQSLKIDSSDDSYVRVTASIGLTCTAKGRVSFDDLYKSADEALYKAKNNGRNRIILG